jgi:hypothetical protein
MNIHWPTMHEPEMVSEVAYNPYFSRTMGTKKGMNMLIMARNENKRLNYASSISRYYSISC